MKRFFLGLICLCLFSHAAFALNPGETLSDPLLEARARAVTREVRCLVCRGESIDESNAPLAADLRQLVRTRITAGDSDDQVRAYLVARYGDYVLLRPPLGLHTLILWVMPFVLLAAAGVAVVRQQRRAGAPKSRPKSGHKEQG